ncbi:MAG: GH1 family beta-glucosidase [Polyangiaceae bacterium]|nr:GH1 family beta-glucosidase [Polyangiaceae bacterium]
MHGSDPASGAALRSFPEGFLWGAATSAFQIEGAVAEGGRKPSIWDTFCERPGAICDGSNAAVACDHYHRWPQDVALMKQLGLGAYRFSIAWPRVLPDGVGSVNPAGISFYDRLVDALLEAGIRPFVTLYHWDLPQALQNEGGWPNRRTAAAFAGFARTVARALGDRVKDWITHNEPWCVSMLGHLSGVHAPGVRDRKAALLAAHHLLLSHGLAVPELRAACAGANVGLTNMFVPAVAASPSEADVDEARRIDGMFNRFFLDPVFFGTYPEDVLRDHIDTAEISSSDLTFIASGDLAQIRTPIDFLGINTYSRAIARSTRIAEEKNLPRTIPAVDPDECTTMGWEVYPPCMLDALEQAYRRWNPAALYVTENGAAFHDAVEPDGSVRDTRRVHYLREHIGSCHEAISRGVPLRGYFVWSLLDNFEWGYGYGQRFGIARVDDATQRRTLKDSAGCYAQIVARNGITVDSR